MMPSSERPSSDVNWVSCPAFRVRQPIGEFFVARMRWSDLKAICFADIRRLHREERGEIESYLGIQRELSKKRVKELQQYVNSIDATFPNSIILAIRRFGAHEEPELADGDRSRVFQPYLIQDDLEGDNIEFNDEKSTLRIRRNERIAKIIDGQHRIAGLEGYSSEDDFELLVTLFVDMDVADQAMVFATINKAQTKVNKSLVYDLYSYAHSRSPQRSLHLIAVALNQRQGSPFFGSIKRLGRADGPEETITQATFVEANMRFVSTNPAKDADLLKRGKKLHPVTGKETRNLVFRPWFINEEDALIARTILDYFDAVRTRWSDWGKVETGNILNRSTGFIALTRLMGEILALFSPLSDRREVLHQAFEIVLREVELENGDFNPDNFRPGSSGQSELLRVLQSGLDGASGELSRLGAQLKPPVAR